MGKIQPPMGQPQAGGGGGGGEQPQKHVVSAVKEPMDYYVPMPVCPGGL